MQAFLQTRRKWGYVLSPIVMAALICYGAIAKQRREAASGGVSVGAQITDGHPTRERDADEDREYLETHVGPLSVSPNAFAKAEAVARALPPSSLLKNNAIGSPDMSLTWTFRALSPIWNDWGNLGYPCTTPLPPNSHCGASARIDAIGVDPTNADIVYVGSEGGLSKSTDGGANWSYLSNDLPSQSIRSIVVDPISPNIIYVGTGTRAHYGKGIYRSVNSGATWTPLGETEFSGSTIAKIAVDPITAGSETSTTLYVSVMTYVSDANNSHSIWRSIDSGAHWTQLRSASGVNYGGDISRHYDIAIDPAAPATVYITAPDGVFKSTGGGGWNQIHTIPNPIAPSGLAIAQSILYLAYRDGNTIIIKSTDQGAHWSSPLPDSGNGLVVFGVDPAHPERIFVGSGPLQYSLNAGSTWLTANEVHVDIHSIAFCPTNTQRHYLGTDGGIYRADYTGGSSMIWYSKNEKLAGVLMQGVSISSDDAMVMGNQDNGSQIAAAPTPNPPWATIRGGDGYQPKIDPNNSRKYYDQGFSYGSTVCRTNSGPCCAPPFVAWQALTRVVNGVQTDVTPVAACGERSGGFAALFVSPNDASRIVIGFKNIYRSTNSGDLWTRIGPNGVDSDPGGAGTALGEASTNPDVIYAVFDRLRVFVTSNAGLGNGATWTQRIDGYEGLGLISAITVDPTNPQTAYIASDSGVWKTINLGITWTQCAIPNLLYQDVAIDPDDSKHVFAASYAGIYASTNGGLNWGNMSAGIPAGMEVTSLSFNRASRHLAASTYGRGAYVVSLPPAVRVTSPVNDAYVSGFVQVSAATSPNVIAVQFQANGVNIGGEDTQFPFSTSWDTSSLSPGDYTLSATARDAANSFTTSDSVVVHVLAPTPSPQFNISGKIFYCSNPVPGPVPSVTLGLSGTASSSTVSDASGNYQFSGLTSGGNYTVTPTKAERPPGTTGVNTVDVLAVQRHFLNVTLIPPGCRLAAADTTGDFTITTVDVIAIQRFYLGLTTGTANVGKYQFNPTNRNYPGVSSNQINQNYDSLVFGDIASPFVE